jgi:hypothetical protein
MSWLPSVRTFRWTFYVAVALAIIAALAPHSPFESSIKDIDKVQHMAAFALLAGLAMFGFPEAPPRLIVERLSFLGAGIEVFQSIPTIHRDCDVWDWAADTFAAAVVVLLLAKLVPARRVVIDGAPL